MNNNLHKQQGVSLFISLILLLVMTIIGITATTTTNLDEKMVANTRDQQISFQAAETAITEAEDFVATLADSSAFTAEGEAGLYLATDPGVTPLWETIDWTGTENLIVADSALPTAEAPKYIIEALSNFSTDDGVVISNYGEVVGAATVDVYRITAYGVGSSSNAKVLLQTTYANVN